MQEKREKLDAMENLDQQDPPVQLAVEVFLACQEFLDPKDTVDSLVLTELKEKWEDLESKEKMDHLDQLDQQDLLEHLDQEEKEDVMVLQDPQD